MNSIRLPIRILWLAAVLGSCLRGLAAETAASPRYTLQPAVQVDGAGVHLDQLLSATGGIPVPHVRIADAPLPGRTLSLAKKDIKAALQKLEDGATDTSLEVLGAETVRVARKMRSLEESEVREMLSEMLQKDLVGGRGDLELRFTRAWNPVSVPDDPLKLRIVDLPLSGLSGNFVLRFELSAGSTLAGTWSIGVQAQVWREIWITRAPLVRGQSVRDADLVLEKRDVLSFKEELAGLDPNDGRLEFSRGVPAGSPIFARMLRVKPVVRRGQVVEALIEDGALQIGAKVEVLEDGAPGQFVRVRNLQSRREFKGKVRDEETIVVAL